MRSNPFHPGFGRPPGVIVGRDPLLERFQRLFATGRGVEATTHLEAHRGTGKTVLVDAIQDLATDAGWHVIQEDAGHNRTPLVPRLIDDALTQRDDNRNTPKRRIKGGQASVFGVSAAIDTEPTPTHPATITLRGALDALISESTNGVLVTIDEIHNATDHELDEIGNAIQHLTRQGKPLAVVVAGLPSRRDREPTFLARCDKPAISAIDDNEIARGLTETAALGDSSFADRALLHAVNACEGSPYMMQLVGYHAYEHATDDQITLADVDAALDPAASELSQSVTIRVTDALSDMERKFLAGMARSGRPARIADIRTHMNRSSKYVSVYRDRLIKTGLIRPAGHGLVSFAIPGLAELVDDTS